MLIYDGDCGICNQSADWARAHLPAGTPVVPWQSVPDLGALGLTVDDVSTAAYWVDEDGTLHRGEAAAVVAFRRVGGPWAIAGHVLAAPGVRQVARWAYYWVARNRYRLSRGGSCAVPEGSAAESAAESAAGSISPTESADSRH